MTGKCKDCVWYNKLYHNHGTGRGFRASHCCTMAFECGKGDIVQVLPNDHCDDFAEVKEEDTLLPHLRTARVNGTADSRE